MTGNPPFEFPARLTHVEAMSVLAGLRQAMAAGVRDVDLRALTEFDSAALAVLLAALRSCSDSTRPRFVNVPDKLSRLANLYGVEGLVFDGRG
jgi:ABC-type transporter Mla MlaB component